MSELQRHHWSDYLRVELQNKEARPEDFVPDQHRFYMKRLTKRGTRHFFNAYEGSSKTSWKRGVLPFLPRGCYSNYKIL